MGKAGTGKTEVGRIFQKLGATFIDADQIVHQLYRKKEIARELVKHFGEEISHKGIINRQKLRNIVFRNKEKLRKLEVMIWPSVKKEMEKIISKARGVVVIEAIKLYEAGMKKAIDKFILVETKENVRLKRLGTKFNEFTIKHLLDIQKKRYPFDYKILNSASRRELEQRVKKSFEHLKV